MTTKKYEPLNTERNYLEKVDLDNCAREPIHIPGSIQPHGAIISFDPTSGVALHISQNLPQFLPNRGLMGKGRSLADLLGEENAEKVLEASTQALAQTVRQCTLTLSIDRGMAQEPKLLNANTHVHKGVGILELEELPSEGVPRDWVQEFEDAVEALRDASDIDSYVTRLANRFKKLSHFDRVMIYRFSEDWSGRVVADAKQPGMESFFDLHYPASDIPAQARELYRHNLVRYIPDVNYQPVLLEPIVQSLDDALDMSHCGLRSVSPIHI